MRPSDPGRDAPKLALPARSTHRRLRTHHPALPRPRNALNGRFLLEADTMLKQPNPSSLGYRMPAEWEPHAATWIAWPHNQEDWPGKFAPVPWVYTEIVRHLSSVENVHIVVRGGTMKRRVADQLDLVGVNVSAVHFFEAATDRVWLRDSGPTFVVNDQERSAALTPSVSSTGSSMAGPSTTTIAATIGCLASSSAGWV